jgi:hypothetical protein
MKKLICLIIFIVCFISYAEAYSNEEICEVIYIIEGEEKANSKLTKKDVKYIRDSNKTGLQLAKELNLAHSTIYRIRNNKTWRHVK